MRSAETTASVITGSRVSRSAQRVRSEVDANTAGSHPTRLASFPTCTAIVMVGPEIFPDVEFYLVCVSRGGSRNFRKGAGPFSSLPLLSSPFPSPLFPSLPLPSLSLLPPLLPCPPFPLFLLPSPPLSLRCRTPLIQLEGLGERWPKTNLVQSEAVRKPLVAIISSLFELRDNN